MKRPSLAKVTFRKNIYVIKRCFQSIRDYLTHLEGDTCKTLGNQENIAQR